jgi:hypothetical protein
MARLVPPPASALASAGAAAVAAAPCATSASATDAGRDKLGGRLPPLTGDREAAGAPCMLAGRRATFPSLSGVRGWRLRCDPGLRSGGGKSRERERPTLCECGCVCLEDASEKAYASAVQ